MPDEPELRPDPLDALRTAPSDLAGRATEALAGLVALGPLRLALAAAGLAGLVWLALGWLAAPGIDPEASLPTEAPSSTSPAPSGEPRTPGDGQAGSAPSSGAPGEPAGPVLVHVTGAVADPGVHVLATGDRVVDALDAAGGALTGAELDRLNLAAPVVDGSRVWVPLPGEEPPAALAPEPAPPADGADADPEAEVVDVNRASASELEALPGVGPATAEAIVEHRERSGRFRSVDDLLEVRGIGPAKLEAMRDRVAL